MMTPKQNPNFFIVIGLFIAALVLSACAPKRVYLNDAERAKLRKEPVIHVVHYTTPVPEVEPPTASHSYVTVKLHDTPTGGEIQDNMGGYDPTLKVAQSFSSILTKSAGLNNLRMTKETTPLPVVKNPAQFKEKYKDGVLLEVWVDNWGFHFVPMDWKTYFLTLGAKARMTRMENGQLIWTVGECGFAGSGKSYDDRIVLGDLKTSGNKKVQAKIKQTLDRIAVECGNQLLQDYSRNK